jgi:DNA-3-methyladenine glycosylase II
MPHESITINLDYTPPLDWGFFLTYLGDRRTGGVETVDGERYYRAIEVGGLTGNLTLAHHPNRAQLVLTIRGGVRKHAQLIAERVRRMFDLDLDPSTIQSAFEADPWLGPLVAARPGIRIPGTWSAFELLVLTIVGQQVTVKASTTIMGRIASRLGRTVSTNGEPPLLLFPSPSTLAEGNLDAIGMPTRRVEALQNVARMIADKAIPFPDSDESPSGVKEALLGLPGIGPWTVEYFALRALREADAWPETDLVLRRLIEQRRRSKTKRAGSVSDRWRPYRGYAAMHLWRHASITPA